MSDSQTDNEIPDCLEDLEKRFRTERKELQAKIQALKKTITKGDKKKKKEVQDVIANLEADIERRYKEEEENLKQISLSRVFTEDNVEANDESPIDKNQENVATSNARISKAGKRRQKKEAASKERDARIQEQDENNLQGPRHKEMVAIVEKLRDRGLAIHGIIADGNCLYSAIEHQLKEAASDSELDYKLLRKLTADYLRQNPDEFLPFLSNQNTGEPMSENDFAAYCHKVEKTTAWGGQIELRALSDALKFPIEVIQAVGPTMTIGEHHLSVKKPLIVTFHRFLYRLGEHYNSVTAFVEDDDQEN